MAATETSMSIATLKKVALCLPPSRSVLLRAGHGVGKSKVVRQISAKIRKQLFEKKAIKDPVNGYPVIDIRLGQRSEGDVIGLPSTDGRVTRFNPPNWYRMACDEPCCLFLDELNRATPEVMQAAFQIALDHELDLNKMHPLSRVYTAINTGAQYQVNEMDPALLSRFFVVDLHPSVKEFVAWARDTDPEQGGNLHYFIPDFVEANEKWLLPPSNAETGTQHPTPRGWEFVNEALVYSGLIENPADPLFWDVCRGFVGNECASAFHAYCKTVDNQITGEEMLNKFHTAAIRGKFDRQSHERRNGLIEKLADYVTKNVTTNLTDQQGKNIAAIMTELGEEHRITLWSKMTSHGIDKIGLAKSIHKHCAKDILNVFGVPMGEAGIGIIPNIPGIFKGSAKGAKGAK
jgi:hypothetical protein